MIADRFLLHFFDYYGAANRNHLSVLLKSTRYWAFANYWKEQEKKKLREQGMEEEKIQKLRQMDRALEQQAGMIDPKRYIGDIVMKNQIELLEQQVRELKREKEKLEKENIRLQKALNKKDLNLLKNL